MKEKQIAIYLIRRLTGLSNIEIGQKFGMKYSAVSKAGINIEKKITEDVRLEKEIGVLISNFEV